jgi:hypothetical protein
VTEEVDVPASNMSDMMRKRRRDMLADSVGDMPYTPPDEETTESSEIVTKDALEAPQDFVVKNPGESDSLQEFTYEPMTDIPGAWVVYPPGIPCDTAEYRITMDHPAEAGDFDSMAQSLLDAGGTIAEQPKSGRSYGTRTD